MKKIISALLLTALLLSTILAIVPVAAEEATEERKSILVNSQPDQYNGIGPAFYYDYRLYTHDINYFPINEAPREDGGTGYQGKRPYMLRSRNASGGSSTSIDGSLDSYISAGAYNSFERGYELNFVTDNMGNEYEFDAWLGICLRETRTIDGFKFYTLNEETCGTKFLIDEITLFGAVMNPETHTYDVGSWFRMTDTIKSVQTNYTDDGQLAVVSGDLYMPFEVDYIFMCFGIPGEGDGKYLCVEFEAYEYTGGSVSIDQLDTAALTEALTAAELELAKEGAYTTASYNLLKKTYDAAKDASVNATNQSTVDYAVSTLYTAIAGLAALADNSALVAEIAKYADAVETDYTISSWATFIEARDAANALIASGNYSEEAIAEKLVALSTAGEGLATKATADALAALKAKYDEAEAIKNDGDRYTPQSLSAIRTATRDTKAYTSEETKDDVSAAQCEAAIKLLEDAIAGLQEKADIDALQAILDEVLSFSAKDYTEESFAALVTAIANAQAFIDEAGANSSAEEAVALGAAITAAKEALVTISKTDFTALDAKIAELVDLVEADYTAESWKALQDAIAAANALNTDATQAEVDAALAAVTAAAEALAKPVVTEPATEPAAEGGCGSIVGATAVVIVASLGLGVATLKRKEN